LYTTEINAPEGDNTAVSFDEGVTTKTVLDGVKITAGSVSTYPVVRILSASPTIRYCKIYGGSGADTISVWIFVASPSIISNVITGGYGTGGKSNSVYMEYSNPLIQGNIIHA